MMKTAKPGGLNSTIASFRKLWNAKSQLTITELEFRRNLPANIHRCLTYSQSSGMSSRECSSLVNRFYCCARMRARSNFCEVSLEFLNSSSIVTFTRAGRCLRRWHIFQKGTHAATTIRAPTMIAFHEAATQITLLARHRNRSPTVTRCTQLHQSRRPGPNRSWTQFASFYARFRVVIAKTP